jgi:hypothetical protein
MAGEAFVAAREGLIERLVALVGADARLAACWLQGSLADGTDDPWSDIDAYVAARDGCLDAVLAERAVLLERLGAAPLVTMVNDTPPLRMVNAVLAGPVKLDLVVEPAADVGDRPRPAVRMLLDKDGIGARLRLGWTPPVEQAAGMVERLFLGTFQGALWPVRLIHRGQWAALVATELQLINDFLVGLLAVPHDPALLFKNPLSRPRHLPPAERGMLDALADAVIAAAATRHLPALLDAHLAIVDAYFRAGRAAYAAVGRPYPLSDASEAAIRAIYRDHWPGA